MSYINPSERVAVRAQDVLLALGTEYERDQEFAFRVLEDLRCLDNIQALQGPNLAVLDCFENTIKQNLKTVATDYRRYLLLFIYAACIYETKFIAMEDGQLLNLSFTKNDAIKISLKKRVDDARDASYEKDTLCCRVFTPEVQCKPDRIGLKTKSNLSLCIEGAKWFDRVEAWSVQLDSLGAPQYESFGKLVGGKTGNFGLRPEQLIQLQAKRIDGGFLFLSSGNSAPNYFSFPDDFNHHDIFSVSKIPSLTSQEVCPMIRPDSFGGFLDMVSYTTESVYLRADILVELLRRHPWIFIFDRWLPISMQALSAIEQERSL